MSLAGYEIFALIGFFFAAYAVIANDSIQTLGTFLASNSHRPWWALWLFAAGIMVAALLFQLFFGGGDIADGKLNPIPYPEGGIQWWHALPPIVLLFLTRFGIPVSTTFLVLTVFALSGGSATEGVMSRMLIKSLTGYVVAFAAGAVVWIIISRMWEVWVGRTRDDDERLHPAWTLFQWATTGFLWWTWLLQDFANIFVFMPRETTTVTTEPSGDGTTALQTTTVQSSGEITSVSTSVVEIPSEIQGDERLLAEFLDASISVSFASEIIIGGALL
ncbi:MAG: hypothetical protein AAFP81_07150, partial [Pseudomonadota bacterium]